MDRAAVMALAAVRQTESEEPGIAIRRRPHSDESHDGALHSDSEQYAERRMFIHVRNGRSITTRGGRYMRRVVRRY